MMLNVDDDNGGGNNDAPTVLVSISISNGAVRRIDDNSASVAVIGLR